MTSSPSASRTSSSTPPPAPAPSFRRLSESELQAKKRAGVCFKCDGRWSRGHECPKAEVHVLLIQDDPEAELLPVPDPALDTIPAAPPEAQLVEVSLNAVVGLTSPKTMKLMGSIRGHDVVVVVDSGATHNFITADLVDKLSLPLSETEAYGVQMGSGASVKGTGVCRAVPLSLQALEILDDFLPLELGSTDVILGVQWLETLGETIHH